MAKHPPSALPQDDKAQHLLVGRLLEESEDSGFEVAGIVAKLMPNIRDTAYFFSTNTKVPAALASSTGQISNVEGCEESATDIPIMRAKKAIDDRYVDRWTCARLAGLIGFSKFDFIRKFKRAFGVSPHQYLIWVRVKHAEDMIKNSSLSLPKIARTVGFGSPSAMQRSFRAVSGMSPGTLVNNIASPIGFAPPGVSVRRL